MGMTRFRIAFLLIGCLFVFSAANALPVDSIGTTTKDGKKYTRHEVESGETWYAIARQYGVTFAELKLANRGSSDLLKPGQVLLVPTGKSKRGTERKHDIEPVPNTPDAQPQSPSTAVTQTHTVGAGETLYGISRKYSVSVDDLKKWNKLTGNSLNKGQKLEIRKSTTSTAHPVVETIVPEQPVPEKQRVPEPVVSVQPMPRPNQEVESEVKPKTDARPVPEPDYAFTNGRKKVTEQGMAGWVGDEDINPNRYYALHRSAPNGTIIRVTNRMNNANVFVKVVGRLPDSGENEGMIIKISKAAADKMGVIDQRFQVDLLYGIQEK